MAEKFKLEPCSHCHCKRVSFRVKRGVVGLVSKTTYYRETIECTKCHIGVFAGTPGNGVLLWNRAWQAKAGIEPC